MEIFKCFVVDLPEKMYDITLSKLILVAVPLPYFQKEVVRYTCLIRCRKHLKNCILSNNCQQNVS